MERSISYLVIAAMLVLLNLDLSGQTKKYDIKSCTMTFEMTQKMAGLDIKKKVVVSFDDYGMRECRETYQGDEFQEAYFSDGKDLYKLQPGKKTAFKRGKADRGTETTIGWNDISSDDKKAGKAKQLPNITIAGKTCESFEYVSDKESTTYAVWNHILMMIDMKSKQMTMLKKAVNVDEKTPVSADKFKVPAGYTLK
jgi:hypothetical protein